MASCCLSIQRNLFTLAVITACTMISIPLSPAAPCKIYPRVLGSGFGFVSIMSIDANLEADRLVTVGHTSDALIIGQNVVSSIPFIAMYSISTTRIYFAKGDVAN